MNAYPKPSAVGGTLIRRVLSTFKKHKTNPPVDRSVLIAVSGGVDSMVMAHLLCRYGRKVLDPKRTAILHFDHGWRPESAKAEKEGVKKLAEQLGVRFIHRKLQAPDLKLKRLNWEEDGRLKRQQVYRELTGESGEFDFVLTAHHQDDQVETVLFRFLRGEILELGSGILFRDASVLRPFLQVSKTEILNYAESEGVPFFEDPGNQDTRHFRSFARREIFPMLERAFPGVKKSLARYPDRFQEGLRVGDPILADVVQGISGKRLNRTHSEGLQKMLSKARVGVEMTLPGGFRVKRLKNGFLIENLDEVDQA